MAALSGVFLAPVLAHDASESGFVTGRKVDCGSGYCSGGRAAALPVAVRAESGDSVGKQAQGGEERAGVVVSRRGLVVSAAALAALALSTESASAVQQNQLAGRIPGLSEPDANGLRTYRRPDGKSGGHGVGWSPMAPYSFKVPQDWEEVPVSIADLGGTEIDLRFQSSQEGNISVVVAPVLRFSSTIGDNATIEAVGTPEKVISAFGPEITGQNVEGKVKSMDVKEYNGRTYYQFELDGPHVLIAATAAGNRLYLMSVSANGRQWKKYAPALKEIVDSFRVA
ncbi:hypothetical protein KC19_2G151300 [Ceratodon purpureus]|uniref:PsbP C-terminal domain-containing protein n=1 Tax=Ceratodon purpureus TaxID=3225 RepID=A0A8T0IVN5_CERPU|nr:hypothetical protein KC19_2G151300 [Ceratodon purpureus]